MPTAPAIRYTPAPRQPCTVAFVIDGTHLLCREGGTYDVALLRDLAGRRVPAAKSRDALRTALPIGSRLTAPPASQP